MTCLPCYFVRVAVDVVDVWLSLEVEEVLLYVLSVGASLLCFLLAFFDVFGSSVVHLSVVDVVCVCLMFGVEEILFIWQISARGRGVWPLYLMSP